MVPLPSHPPRLRFRPIAGAALVVLAALVATGCGTGDRAADDGALEHTSQSDQQAETDANTDANANAASEAEAEAAAEPESGSPDRRPQSEQAEADDWCATEALAAEVTPLDAGAGNRYAALVLTNTTDAACRTQGWPGLELAAADGAALPTETVRDDSRAAVPLTLAPGESAWAQLRWTVVPGSADPADGGCGPEPTALRVIPPDTYDATPADWELGAVCGPGRIEALPLAEGEGP
ncbi:DUF4232 domain-containing protein [Streptomyces sp. NBRC 109706]|uniref:DUF4232 domain-containing protein n=1 Tax=Streptomyces sp. NBRC 109706 TaxID=1550035 RepID=UPI0007822932|nr:DUF4232 domain-containing protein [Streptomyces sp. NBRC 109706]